MQTASANLLIFKANAMKKKLHPLLLLSAHLKSTVLRCEKRNEMEAAFSQMVTSKAGGLSSKLQPMVYALSHTQSGYVYNRTVILAN